MRRVIVWVVVTVVVLAVSLLMLDRTRVLVSIGPEDVGNAPTIPACNGHALSEGVTYHIRGPKHGEVVVFRATGAVESTITPDAKGGLYIARRVIGVPGDQVVGRGGRVYVNGVKADDIRTAPFPRVDLGSGEYFVLGDNRSDSQDSRNFGPVPRNAIFGRVFIVYRPLGEFGGLPSRRTGAPPGQITC